MSPSRSKAKNEFGPLDLREQWRLGWFIYRPRMTPDLLSVIREEGFDPSRSGMISPPLLTPIRSPTSEGPEGMVHYVFENILLPLRAHPLAAIIAAVEDRVSSKIFVRPTELLGPGIEGVSKAFLLEAVRKRHDPGILAFFGVLYRLLSDEESRSPRCLIQRFTLAHEIMHHYLHIYPSLQAAGGDPALTERIHGQYEEFLRDGTEPDLGLGPPPDVAEYEADLGALLTLLEYGYLRMESRSEGELRQLDRALGLGMDVGPFATTISEYGDRVHRPATLARLPLEPDAPSSSINRTGRPTERRCSDIVAKARSIGQSARRLHYSWVCRAIEDRFLRRRGERKKTTLNVSIRLQPYETEAVFCVVERLELKSAFPQVNQTLHKNPPHLIRYSIRYPHTWDVLGVPDHRLKVLQWLGLVDRWECRHPPSRMTTPRKKTLRDYSPDTQAEAMMYAVALDALCGDMGRYDDFSTGHARWMLSGSSLSIDSLLEDAHLGRHLESLLVDRPVQARAAGDRVDHAKQRRDVVTPPSARAGEAVVLVEGANNSKALARHRRAMKRDMRWFEQHADELLEKYGPQHVAVRDEDVIDHDADLTSLVQRTWKRHGIRSLYIGSLGAAPVEDRISGGLREHDLD